MIDVKTFIQDGENQDHYSYSLEYTVGEDTVTLEFHDSETYPGDVGTVIKLWVDPDNPEIFTSSRDWKKAAVESLAVPLIIVVMGLLMTMRGRKRHDTVDRM